MSQQANITNTPIDIGGGQFSSGQSTGSWQAIIPGTTRVVAIGGSSAQSVAFQASTSIVRVAPTSDAWIKFGSNPTADITTSIFMAAGTVEYFGVKGGNKVAVLQDSAAGSLSICEGL